jgi:hypothetical protein
MTRREAWLACKAGILPTSRRVLSSRPAPGHPMPIPSHASDEDTLGSYSRSGLITPSPRLVQIPTDCIDSMLLHAWCHLKEHQHGKQYSHLLESDFA